MTAWDAFGFTDEQSQKLDERYQKAYDAATEKSHWGMEMAEKMLIEILAEMTDAEKEALALGCMIGRMSR